MRRSWVSVGLMILSCALGVTLPALAVSLTFATIDPPGATNTTADGISSAGQIVGSFLDAAGKTHGYVATLPR